ncbi:MAG: hypothetical protein IJ240_08120 [Clostridia bacterium]|nr:hypothetical protein [Clostridia bacterium]
MDIDLRILTPSELYRELEKRTIVVGLTTVRNTNPMLHETIVQRQKLYVMIAPDDPLADFDVVPLSELTGRTVVTSSENDTYYQQICSFFSRTDPTIHCVKCNTPGIIGPIADVRYHGYIFINSGHFYDYMPKEPSVVLRPLEMKNGLPDKHIRMVVPQYIKDDMIICELAHALRAMKIPEIKTQ